MDPDLLLPFKPTERRLALAELLRFAQEDRWQAHSTAATVSFFARLPDSMSDDELKQIVGPTKTCRPACRPIC